MLPHLLLRVCSAAWSIRVPNDWYFFLFLCGNFSHRFVRDNLCCFVVLYVFVDLLKKPQTISICAPSSIGTGSGRRTQFGVCSVGAFSKPLGKPQLHCRGCDGGTEEKQANTFCRLSHATGSRVCVATGERASADQMPSSQRHLGEPPFCRMNHSLPRNLI